MQAVSPGAVSLACLTWSLVTESVGSRWTVPAGRMMTMCETSARNLSPTPRWDAPRTPPNEPPVPVPAATGIVLGCVVRCLTRACSSRARTAQGSARALSARGGQRNEFVGRRHRQAAADVTPSSISPPRGLAGVDPVPAGDDREEFLQIFRDAGLELRWDSIQAMVAFGTVIFGVGLWRFGRQSPSPRPRGCTAKHPLSRSRGPGATASGCAAGARRADSS
jgi:hypothetical protein